jgi:hypothetical protein
MKLPSALALAARPMDVPAAQLRVLLHALDRQQAEGTQATPSGPMERVSDEGVDSAGPAPLLSRSLLASHSLLTRTINLLK